MSQCGTLVTNSELYQLWIDDVTMIGMIYQNLGSAWGKSSNVLHTLSVKMTVATI